MKALRFALLLTLAIAGHRFASSEGSCDFNRRRISRVIVPTSVAKAIHPKIANTMIPGQFDGVGNDGWE